MRVVLMTRIPSPTRRLQKWRNGSAKEYWSTVQLPTRLPRHVAVVMDGNRRWASQRGFPQGHGHFAASRAADDLIEACFVIGIPALTLFALSTENLNRRPSELYPLLRSIEAKIEQSQSQWKDRQYRVQFIGNFKEVSTNLTEKIEKVQTETGSNNGLRLTVALGYSGRQDLLQSIQKLVHQLKSTDMDSSLTTESDIESFLQSQQAFGDVGSPDLFIRTGGELRLSNFLLWDLAYTELYFDETLWPDYNADNFLKALQEYSRRERRYGQ